MGRGSLAGRNRAERAQARWLRRGSLASALLVALAASVGFSLSPASAPAPLASPRSALSGVTLWVDSRSDAARQAREWSGSRPRDAALMARMAAQPSAQWLGDWTADPRSSVAARMSAAARGGSAPVFVLYDIPKRDCGSYSAGGARGEDAYRAFVRQVADGVGGRRAVVVLEPDALAGMDCLSRGEQETRMRLISDAIGTLDSAGATVYVDAGNPDWVPAEAMAERLGRAGIDRADGFALNVSNFYTTAQNVAYGSRLSALVGGKHFIVDTSRNGVGPAGGRWCNPPGRALGIAPTTDTGQPLVDAYLWIKTPGQSDGTCNGGPPAGRWWPEYALGLAERAPASAFALSR